MTRRATILLVDDDRHLVDSMAHWLRDLGHDVDVVDGLSAADQALKQREFELVITDLRLGNEDGFDLISMVKSVNIISLKFGIRKMRLFTSKISRCRWDTVPTIL